jgi:hypothetical protein
MKFKKGILYGLKNDLWGDDIHKIGNTGQTLKSRISTIQTSLYLDCETVSHTDNLTCCLWWEKILENMLAPYRVNPKREFYYITEEEIKMIFNFINEFNKILDTEQKLLKYIQEKNPEYFYKKRIYKSESSSDEKPRRKKGLFVDTSY